jgi:metallo-beta-lactamase family protein
VKLDGQAYPINAEVHQLGGYSAHADQAGLVAWARAVQPRAVKLVHGEKRAQRVLGGKLAGIQRIF